MRVLVLAILVVCAGCGAASAYCPSLPDNGDTHYIENQKALALCLAAELAAEQAARQRLQQMQADFDLQLQLQEQQQRLDRQLATLPQFTPPALPQF